MACLEKVEGKRKQHRSPGEGARLGGGSEEVLEELPLGLQAQVKCG